MNHSELDNSKNDYNKTKKLEGLSGNRNYGNDAQLL